MKSTQTLVVFFVAALAAAPARADAVVYSSFGPGDTYKDLVATYFGFDFGEEGDPDSRFARAMSFEPRTTASLTSIELALSFPFSFSDGTLQVNLYESDSGMPGAAIEHFDAAPAQTGNGIFRFDSVSHPTLLAGRTYFLEATTDGVADGLWFFSPNPVFELVPDVYRNLGGPWQQGLKDFNAAFRVSGDAADAAAAAPTPEPASLALLATGLGIAAWRRRRLR
jgi:hypothetical protein